jgi:hypothetical protein
MLTVAFPIKISSYGSWTFETTPSTSAAPVASYDISRRKTSFFVYTHREGKCRTASLSFLLFLLLLYSGVAPPALALAEFGEGDSTSTQSNSIGGYRDSAEQTLPGSIVRIIDGLFSSSCLLFEPV